MDLVFSTLGRQIQSAVSGILKKGWSISDAFIAKLNSAFRPKPWFRDKLLVSAVLAQQTSLHGEIGRTKMVFCYMSDLTL